MNKGRIMVQGTGSHVGKSVVATVLCRIFAQDGFNVTPYKSQNMALNSYVTKDGGEMGRAQVVQAEAAGVAPHVDMNPILLKPTSDHKSQVVVLGHAVGTMSWREYGELKPELFAKAMAAFQRLSQRSDIVVIEGAGSPAEVNLRDGDIVNMKVARQVGAPVLLVTDIDRGGALAWVVGTLELLEPEERAMVKGILINKFRGSYDLLQPAIDFLEKKTGIPVVGVLPYVRDIEIPEEDSLGFGTKTKLAGETGYEPLDVAVVRVPRASNFTDIDALLSEPDISLRYISAPEEIGSPDLLIIPGSKNTIDDLCALGESGVAEEIRRYARDGGCVVGLCGGYQMLGDVIEDPDHVESDSPRVRGLGLLPVKTVIEPKKRTVQVRGSAVVPEGRAEPIVGYEIHCGKTTVYGGRPWALIASDGQSAPQEDGCCSSIPSFSGSQDGWAFGTYVHGIFDSAGFRRGFLNWLRQRKGLAPISDLLVSGRPYDKLADALRPHLNMEYIYNLMGMDKAVK